VLIKEEIDQRKKVTMSLFFFLNFKHNLFEKGEKQMYTLLISPPHISDNYHILGDKMVHLAHTKKQEWKKQNCALAI
jgi:hypothetical protein